MFDRPFSVTDFEDTILVKILIISSSLEQTCDIAANMKVH